MPLCEQCRENDAVVFITQIIDGHVTTMTLCASCAETKGVMTTRQPPDSNVPPDLERVLEAMGIDHAAEMAKLQEEILNLPEDAPGEVALPESMTVQALADALRAQVHQVIFVLLQHGKFSGPEHEVDFATASLVCEQFAVMARRE
jgi:hypothetical protein